MRTPESPAAMIFAGRWKLRHRLCVASRLEAEATDRPARLLAEPEGGRGKLLKSHDGSAVEPRHEGAAVRDHRTPRRRGDGRSLSRARPAARPSVAIKVLSDQSAGDPEIRERFEREARAVAALAHPGIVGIFEMPIVDGRVCLVLELLDGESLRVASRARPAVAAADRRRRTADRRCARGRARQGHRPSRPEARERVPHERGPRQAARLRHRAVEADRAGEPRRTDDRLDDSGQILGTPGHLAPEQAARRGRHGEADLFSSRRAGARDADRQRASRATAAECRPPCSPRSRPDSMSSRASRRAAGPDRDAAAGQAGAGP